MNRISPLHKKRLEYKPKLPNILKYLPSLFVEEGESTTSESNSAALKNLFSNTFGQPLAYFSTSKEKEHKPLKVAVLLSGGQAPGGHNVIAGLYDALQTLNQESILIGFLNGPDGLIKNNTININQEVVDRYRNQGGFDLICSSRAKIESKEQFAAAAKTSRELQLDGIVIIGGDDSNTNAAMLAEYFKNIQCCTSVIGVPKTIDGDLKNKYVESSFGFDTACKVYSELIGNISRDCLSARKYTYFIKLMGRSASHITLECALQTHPNMALISEEIAEKQKTLADITNDICDMICSRAKYNKNYSVILIPEGLIEFIPEIKTLIKELNEIISQDNEEKDHLTAIADKLSPESAACFKNLPQNIQEQMLEDRDPHGNVQVSKIETEKLLIDTVKTELKKRKQDGKYIGDFSYQNSFFGYEGRCAMPSNFDCDYCYSLGYTAIALISQELTGYMSSIQNLKSEVDEWQPLGVPITMMMNIEQRHGKSKAVIKKALVNLDSPIFEHFKSIRKEWLIEDNYRYPGPIQFFGDSEITDVKNFTLTT